MTWALLHGLINSAAEAATLLHDVGPVAFVAYVISNCISTGPFANAAIA